MRERSRGGTDGGQPVPADRVEGRRRRRDAEDDRERGPQVFGAVAEERLQLVGDLGVRKQGLRGGGAGTRATGATEMTEASRGRVWQRPPS